MRDELNDGYMTFISDFLYFSELIWVCAVIRSNLVSGNFCLYYTPCGIL